LPTVLILIVEPSSVFADLNRLTSPAMYVPATTW
jgi:hypothetical protein